MVALTDALDRLRKEKEYEDDLVVSLTKFFLSSLKSISDLNSKEETAVREKLSRIASDSEGHSRAFNSLIEMVIENGDNSY